MGFKITRGIKNIKFEETYDEWIRLLIESGFSHPIWNKESCEFVRNTLSLEQTTVDIFQEIISFKRQDRWFTYVRATGFQSFWHRRGLRLGTRLWQYPNSRHRWVTDEVWNTKHYWITVTNTNQWVSFPANILMLSGMKKQVFNLKYCWVCLHFDRTRLVKRPLHAMDEMSSTHPPVNRKWRKKRQRFNF